MGLDTYLQKHYENYTDDMPEGIYEDNEVCYWRKCWGLDHWLSSKATKVIEEQCVWEINTSVLKEPLAKMEKYIDKLIKKSNDMGYLVDDTEELRIVVNEIEDDNEKDYEKLLKIIKSFSCNGLDMEVFADSIWSTLSTFINTYNQFKKAIEYPTLILVSSY